MAIFIVVCPVKFTCPVSANIGVLLSWSFASFSEWSIIPPAKLTVPPLVATNAPSFPVFIVFPVPFKFTTEELPSAIPPIPWISAFPAIVTVPPEPAYAPIFVYK